VRTTLIWPECAGGDAGGDVEREKAFAEAGVAREERDTAERNAAGPEPAYAGGSELVEALGAYHAFGAAWFGTAAER
jgi:hypothetical protein